MSIKDQEGLKHFLKVKHFQIKYLSKVFILNYKSYFLNGIHNATIIAVMTVVGMLKLDPGVHFNYVK